METMSIMIGIRPQKIHDTEQMKQNVNTQTTIHIRAPLRFTVPAAYSALSTIWPAVLV